MNTVKFVYLAMAMCLLSPSAYAQETVNGAIAGIVRDTSGAVLPGVTVEAASPALIEKVRSVVTNDQGQYTIVSLRPGTYIVTFSLSGFVTVRREGIVLTSGFTAPVNVELKIGSIEETITVTGATPIVDAQNTRQQMVLNREMIESLPINKEVQGFAAITPGAVITAPTVDVGGSTHTSNTTMSVHGSAPRDMRNYVDGINVAAMYVTGGGTSRHYTFNPAAGEEITIQTQTSAEGETGGPAINLVPRDGGNTFRVNFEAEGTDKRFQGENLTSDLVAQGVTSTNRIGPIWAVRAGAGGAIVRDKLWYFGSFMRQQTTQYITGSYYNKRAGTLFYEPDFSRPGYTDSPVNEQGARITWQAAAKHKFTGLVSIEDGSYVSRWNGLTGTTTPESAHHVLIDPLRLYTGSWTFPATSRLLFEAGAGRLTSINIQEPTHPSAATAFTVTELSNGFVYGSKVHSLYSTFTNHPHNVNDNYSARAAMSYVTGSHAFKFGFSQRGGTLDVNLWESQSELYTFRNQLPVSIQQVVQPFRAAAKVRWDAGVYGQDQWTRNKLTVNLGLRLSWFSSNAPETVVPAGKYSPGATFPETEILDWKDLQPRLGFAYDLFGNGKTALKAAFNRYVLMEGTGITQTLAPANAMVTTATRTWNDSLYPVGDGRRGNYVPDCDLHNPGTNGECGALSNPDLGKPGTSSIRYAESITNGWHVRPSNWQASLSIQHELRPGLAVNVGYFRTWYDNFSVTDNLMLSPSDHDPYCITVPTDQRLLNGGGGQLCGLYDLKPEKFGVPADNLVRPASDFGEMTSVFNGVDVTFDARLPRGQIGGGFSYGQYTTDSCFVVDSPQDNLFCRKNVAPSVGGIVGAALGPMQFKLHAIYPLPWDIQVSATYQNVAGPPLEASYVATNAEIASSLGRNLGVCRGAAVCTGTVVVPNLFSPDQEFLDRRNQVDVRVSKFIRVGRVRVGARVEAYNLLNSDFAHTVNTRYSTTTSYLRPTSILLARFVKFGASVNF
jgi:hypothetical protein